MIYEYDFWCDGVRVLEFRSPNKIDPKMLDITGYGITSLSPWTCICAPDYWRILISLKKTL